MSVASRALGSKYQLESLIGTGAMGEVWRAVDRATGEAVAAKVLRSEYSRNQDIVGRFVRERSILMGLDHPGIVRVRDLVVEGDDLAIVMDLVEGEDLRHALRSAGTLPPALAVGVVSVVLHGLAAAHAQGALHRDVKPDNVLLTEAWRDLEPGSVRLSDFSIARLAQDSTVQATGLLGTPEYMPPELFSLGTTSAATDVYAAGVVLYELLAGRSPYAGPGTAFTIGSRAVTCEPPKLGVPSGLWQLLASLLAKDPRRRPRASDAADQLTALAPALLGMPALPVQPTPDTWVPSGAAPLAAGPIHTADENAAIDVGGTNLDVVFAPEEARAATGEVAALAPVAIGLGLEAGVTNVGAAPAYTPPRLEPAVAPLPESGRRSRRRTIAIAAGVVAGVALVVGAVVMFTGGGKDTKGGGSAGGGVGALRSSLDDAKVPGTGLSIRRSAEYDADKSQVTLTYTVAADRVALKGPLLEVLPQAKNDTECPLPAWEGAQAQPNDIAASGITVPCAYRLTVPPLNPGEPQQVSATLPLSLGGQDPQKALDDWLATTQDATGKALDSASRTNPAYAAQRLQGIQVSAPGFATTSRGQIRIRLFPEWSSGLDELHPLFDSTKGGATALLDEVAGGLDNVKLYDDCNGAVLVRRRTVTVLRQSEKCTVLASVGNLSDLRSNEFQISGTSS